MGRSALKKNRLLVGMTQTQVADAMGVSQPNYQRWEAGTAPVPKTKLKKLAKILKTTVDEILGKPKPFDLFGVDETIGDDRKYFGEVTIHFASNGGALLLPLSEEERVHLHRQLGGGSAFISTKSLDNQIVFIRRAAIKDIYFSSEAYDDYGPESYENYIGIFPDDDFWRIVEHMDYLDFIEGENDQSRIDEVLDEVVMTEEKLDRLIADGTITPEDREKVMKDADEAQERLINRSTSIIWQLSSGQLRQENIHESKVLYEAFSPLDIDPDDPDDMIYLPIEGYHRTIFINKAAIDYISIPTHKFNEGELESVEEELDDT